MFPWLPRPVTLVGFSLGARVVYKCLQTLATYEDNGAMILLFSCFPIHFLLTHLIWSAYNWSEGIIERVVLLGAPVSAKGEQWDIARKVWPSICIYIYLIPYCCMKNFLLIRCFLAHYIARNKPYMDWYI